MTTDREPRLPRSEAEREMAAGLIGVNPEDNSFYRKSTWGSIPEVRIEAALSGAGVREPEFLARRPDGVKLIYAGRRHAFWGPAETLKSFAALVACVDVIESGKNALYIDFEDDEFGLVDRTRSLQIPDDYLLSGQLTYVRPDEAFGKNPVLDFDGLRREDFGIVVFDGVTEAMMLLGLHPYDPVDTAKYQHLLTRSWGDAAVVEIDHTGKGGNTGQLGSFQKRAGLDGVSVEFVLKANEGRGGHSKVELYVHKDRHGHVREHLDSAKQKAFFGTFHVVTTPGSPPDAYIEYGRPPSELIRDEVTAMVEEDALPDRVVAWLQEHPASKTRDVKAAALGPWPRVESVLKSDDRVQVEDGSRGAKLYSVNGVLVPGTRSN